MMIILKKHILKIYTGQDTVLGASHVLYHLIFRKIWWNIISSASGRGKKKTSVRLNSQGSDLGEKKGSFVQWGFLFCFSS